jgi:hypothetical protein
LLDEKNIEKQSNFDYTDLDFYSPFTQLQSKRLNHFARRTIIFLENEKEIKVVAEMLGDDSYLLTLPEANNQVKVSGTLQNGRLRAFVDDHLINAAGKKQQYKKKNRTKSKQDTRKQIHSCYE